MILHNKVNCFPYTSDHTETVRDARRHVVNLENIEEIFLDFAGCRQGKDSKSCDKLSSFNPFEKTVILTNPVLYRPPSTRG